MSDVLKQILQTLPDLEAELNRTMHHGLKAKLAVEDVVQETYVRAVEHLPNFEYRGEASLRAWLRTIARNVVCGRIRRKNTCDLGELVQSIVESGGLRPSELARQRETIEELRVAVLQLTDEQQRLLRMHYVESATYEEIASAIGVNSGVIRGRHRNAIEKLRRLLDARHSIAART